MKLKSPTAEPVQVALLSGHIIRIPHEGREVPQRFLQDAFKAGCLPVGVDIEDVAGSVAGQDESAGKTRGGIIRDAIKAMLEAGAEMTAAGLPNLKELSKVAGFTVERNEMVDAWNAVQEEASANDCNPDSQESE